MRRWIFISFLVGFALVGGIWAWIVYADETDIHQQSYRPEKAATDALKFWQGYGFFGQAI